MLYHSSGQRDEIIRIVFRHMSVGVLSMLCSNAFCPGYDQIKMVVVLLLALCAPVNALLLQRTRDEIIRIIYEQGFQYGLILCFLVSVYGICISLSTLKRCLTTQHLKGEGFTVIYNIMECVCWNSHVISRRRGGISGIPEELYNIPALYGMIYMIYKL